MPRSAADTPLLRVSRPVSACSRCRAAKIKCDGKLPACSACERAGRQSECSSANDQFAKGKERSYVASLEARVEKLQKRIAFARARKASAVMHDTEPVTPPERKDSLATIRAAIHQKAAKRRETSDVNELVSDFGVLSVNATTRDFDTSTTNMTFCRLVLAAAVNEPLPKQKPVELPPRAEAMKLIQYYLDNVFCLIPVFPETAFLTAVDNVYRSETDSQSQAQPDLPSPDQQQATDLDHWLLYMTFAISLSCQSKCSDDALSMRGMAWVSRALKYGDRALTPGYLSQIQALVLLVEYSMVDPIHFDSWQLIGFAARTMIDLGFHQDPPKELQPEKALLDMRRRVFYCVYALDRLVCQLKMRAYSPRSISMVHARAFSFADDATSVGFPNIPARTASSPAETAIPGPHSLQPARLLFELRMAQSKWYQELFQSSRDPLQQASSYTWQMCQEMRNWFDSLPSDISPPLRDRFEVELLYSFVYCLAPSCRIPAVSELGKISIFEHSIAFMQKMMAISEHLMEVGVYTYHDALRVYFVGSQFLAVLWHSKDHVLNAVPSYYGSIIGASSIGSPSSQDTPPPNPRSTSAAAENVGRSVTCIYQIKDVLAAFGSRWPDSTALLASFDIQAEPILADLHHRRQHLDLSARGIAGTDLAGAAVVTQPFQDPYTQRRPMDILYEEATGARSRRVYATGMPLPDALYIPVNPHDGAHEGGI